MYIVIITMPVVVVVIAGCDLKQIDIMRHGLDFLKQQKQKKRKTVSEVCSCFVRMLLLHFQHPVFIDRNTFELY